MDDGEWEEEDGIAEAIEESRRSEEEARNTAAGSTRAAPTIDEPEGLRTPRAMQPVDSTDVDLSSMALNALSLTETATRTDPSPEAAEDSPSIEDDDHPTQVEIDSSAVPPRDIPTPASSGSGTRRYELTPGPLSTENVLTPRNDVGPFVLDGGADRGSTGAGARSLDAAATASATASS